MHVRQGLVNAMLEHLLEREDFRQSFGDWKGDAVLADAYAQALVWYQHGGKSPLGKSRR